MALMDQAYAVRQYLDDLSWDGIPRLDKFLTTYFGAGDNEFIRAVSSLTMIAAVRRVRQPGCKFDEMLVLEGPQGGNKSSGLTALVPKGEWFTDDLPLNSRTQEFIERTAGRWIVEAAELSGMRKGDVESLKACLSRRADCARLAYGRIPLEKPRQFVIVGTTNSERYLMDNTGHRRFWPVRFGLVDVEAIARDRDQIWAEAASREANGESIRLDPSLYNIAAQEQESRRVEDPILDRLADTLGDIDGKLRAEDVWRIVGVHAGNRNQYHQQRVGDAMRELGWSRKKRRFGGRPEGAYVKGDGSKRILVELDREGVPRIWHEEDAF